jgi:hypothetical protein
VKTDRVDTLGLLRVLLRLERGETEMTRVVWVPAPAIVGGDRQPSLRGAASSDHRFSPHLARLGSDACKKIVAVHARI